MNESARATRILGDGTDSVREISAYRLVGAPDVEITVRDQTRLRVGADPGNDLVINDATVSRYHLEIVVEGEGYLLRDLASANGTWVDGMRVREVFLPATAELTLGQAKLAFSVCHEVTSLPASSTPEFGRLVGRSLPMRELFAQLRRVAPTDATVLIEGESGTGKELVALAIHEASRRSSGPFVVFDCAAVPPALAESELFGHQRGAFTGANSDRVGRFEEADGGTLFIDELGELPLELQPKLLRVLETRQVRRIGGQRLQAVDVRIVTATNRDLAVEVNQGSFRADLYYRLAVVPLRLAALRQRREDIRPLAEHFIQQALADPKHATATIRGISADNWTRLQSLPWRGNARELRNFIERTLILSDGPKTTDLPASPLETQPGTEDAVELLRPFAEAKSRCVEAFERSYLFGQLQRHHNNISAAARASGLDRMNFKRLLRKYR